MGNNIKSHTELGRKGEELAVALLRKKGYSILSQNYRYLKAEIDILAQKEGVLAVVEVKTRSEDFIQDPLMAVGKKKIRLLVMAADNFVQENALEVEIRFDIIRVIHTRSGKFELDHLKNAFYHF